MEAAIAIPVAVIACGIALKFSDVVRWCRWIYAYIYIKYDRRFTKQRLDLYDMEALHDPVKIGLLPPQEEILLESAQNRLHLEKAGDEISFYGLNSTSECFMARVSRGLDTTESWIYLRLKNGRAYQLDISGQNSSSTNDISKVFSCGGLKIHYIEPMRIWRIFFNGLMKEIAENEEATGRMVYIKFIFRWRSSTDCFDTLSDIDISCLASGFSRIRQKGLLSYLTQLKDAANSYSQGGVIRGEVTVDTNSDTLEMYLFGHKMRYLGNMAMIPNSKITHLFGWMTKYGSIVHFTELSLPNVIENLLYGYMVTPDGKIEVAQKVQIEKGNLTDQNQHILISCHADGADQVFKGNSDERHIFFGSKSTQEIRMNILTTELNSYPGRGILMQRTFYKMKTKTAVKPLMKSVQKVVPLVVSFTDVLCQNADITGGKGSSLSKLAEKSKEYQTFIVPNGIVATTKAYKEIIADNIVDEVQILADILYGNLNGDVKEACSKVMKAVIQTEVSSDFLEFLAKSLQDKFGDNFEQKTYAIRSSALGEDTEDMSAAGQMETHLGVSGLDQILKSIKKCWASQFGYVAVQYKRKNGQILDSPMAVVVQEMVPCDIAGVIFTCDPLTGNPTLLAINSNYGLGESVVSGAEEPDTIVLERDADDNLTIKQEIIGAKSHRFVLKGDEGTTQEDIPEAQRKLCSLTDTLSIRLGKVAVKIEKECGSPRDIEWGYWNNNLYLFQSRPVTNIADETDYEIDHESDSPLRVENDYFTVCNVGEVMPGATSPLGTEMMKKTFGSLLQKKMFKDFITNSKYCPKGLVSLYSHVMMFGSDLFAQINVSEAMVKSQMINFFGRIIEEEDLFDLSRERHRRKKKMGFVKICFTVLLMLVLPSWMIRKTKKFYETYRIEVEKFKTSQELFDAILYTCTDHGYAMLCHMTCTALSGALNNLLISLLEKAKGALDADVYSDFSILLSSITEIESAEVPSEIESLAFLIAKDMDPAQFQKMSIEDAKTWLLSSTAESGEKFRDFLKKHGHRCLKELDIREFTWEEKPDYLIETLQGLVGCITIDKFKKETKSYQKMLSQLKTPLGAFNRFKLRYFLLPFCRSGVQFRESAKSLWVKGQHHWRIGYKALGKLMVAEGLLPDEDLIFFMAIIEIQELLINKSSKIISRALHRRRRHQILDGYIFPEIMSGLPRPINMNSSEETPVDENSSMTGTPVSQGIVKGYARVAMTLKEASHLKPGEILLTYSTDVGWTPYFPALAGVGTELGGLISHGAVVSREYGLPCIAGLHGVTRQFKTGDYVLLDGSKGLLQKLPQPE